MSGRSERLALGCAQLGMRYGIKNTAGQPDPAEAREIVAICLASGVRFFDTAQAYGESEAVLGDALAATSTAKVISKISPGTTECRDLSASVRASLDRLGKTSLWGLLLHHEDELDSWDRGIGEQLRELRAEGLVEHLGVSVYSAARALEAIEHPDVEVIQLPGNIFDRRPLRAGVLPRAQELGKRVFIRSVYLQGLALLAVDDLPPRLTFAKEALLEYAAFCDDYCVERNRFALSYARDRFATAVLVIGAETPRQAEENCRLIASPGFGAELYSKWDARWPNDMGTLIDPSKWPRE